MRDTAAAVLALAHSYASLNKRVMTTNAQTCAQAKLPPASWLPRYVYSARCCSFFQLIMSSINNKNCSAAGLFCMTRERICGTVTILQPNSTFLLFAVIFCHFFELRRKQFITYESTCVFEIFNFLTHEFQNLIFSQKRR